MVRAVPVFLAACVLGGVGAALGSVLGHLAAHRVVVPGGIAGGLLGAASSATLARRRDWIGPQHVSRTAIGASIGFLVAAAIALRTLGSPVGPVLSTLCIGLGAVLGARSGGRSVI